MTITVAKGITCNNGYRQNKMVSEFHNKKKFDVTVNKLDGELEKKDTNVTTDTRRDKVNPQDDIHDALFKYTIPVQLKPSRRIGDEKRVPKWQVRNEERCGLRLKPITASQPIIIITIT